MNDHSSEYDHDSREKLSFADELVDAPAGARLMRMLFGDTLDEEEMESPLLVDRGFACVA